MLFTPDELSKMTVMDPEIAAYMEKNPRPAVDMSDHTILRKAMDLAQKASMASMPPAAQVTEVYHEVVMRDGFESSLKIHKPADGPPGPLIVYAFGGGFIVGSNEQFTRIGRALVKLFGATVVSISYRLGPEDKFPAAQYDTDDSTRWIADNATGSLLNSDPSKGFILSGVSAGGALAASYSRVFQEKPLAHPLTGQWLCVPSVMDATCYPQGYKEYYIAPVQQAESVFLSKKIRDWFKELTQWDSSSPLRYAINSKTPLSGQPKTYFQVDGLDPLRDDALIYDDMLKKAGVETKLDFYEGCPHAHSFAFPTLEIGKKADIDTVVGFGWLLGKEITRDAAAKELGL